VPGSKVIQKTGSPESGCLRKGWDSMMKSTSPPFS